LTDGSAKVLPKPGGIWMIQHGEFAEVLGGGGEVELVAGAVRSS
jgi:hypothetical protein